MKKFYVLWFVVLFLIGCSDAKRKQFTSLGSPAYIKCMSGDTILYEGKSTGKVSTEENSDGWYFEDAKTGELIRVSGACLIRN